MACDILVLHKLFLSDIKKQALASFSNNVINILLLLFILLSSGYANKLKPEELKNQTTFMCFHYLINPCFSFMMFAIMYYVRHKPLRNVIVQEIKGMFNDNLCNYWRSDQLNFNKFISATLSWKPIWY